MPRIRSIKPESCLSETLAELSDRACLLFAYLPCFCDDEGRMRYSPRLVKAQLFPLRDRISTKDCETLVEELATHGLVILYEANGEKLLQITNFLEHQHPQKPRPSEFPAPDWERAAAPDACSGGEQDAYRSDTVQVGENGEGSGLPGISPNTVPVQDGYGTNTACRVIGEGVGEGEVVGVGIGEVEGGEDARDGAGEERCTAETVNRIVTYLNHKTGKNFKASTAKTQRDIRARWREGFRYGDFTRVIDVKCAQWGRDRKMAGYLRPETLFGTKFEGYLNEQPPKPGSGGGGRYAAYN